jgi:biotin transport system substrate-specific component
MQIAVALNQTKYQAFHWRANASLPWKITLALVMAGLTGLLAQVRIQLPFTPIPLTGQTFAVLLSGVLLGRKWGGISLAIYIVLGIAGIPWFNSASSGLTATAGYLIGFTISALFIGYVTDRYPKARSFHAMFGIMLFASLILVYIPGLLWLGFWSHTIQGSAVDIASLIGIGVLPFISGDILKAVMAAMTARIILPKESFTDGSRLT